MFLSDYTFAVRDVNTLKIIGKVYAGLMDEEIEEICMRLKEITIKDESNRIIVEPVIIEVTFDSVSKSNRYDSIFAEIS